MAVSRRLRFEILRRDGYACRYCGSRAPDVSLTVDHVIPVALGGGDEPSNLVAACSGCNSGKASVGPESPLVEDVDAAALLWAKAIERVNAKRRSELAELEQYLALVEECWDGYNNDGTPIPKPNDWSVSIERFATQGLQLDEIQRFIRVAMLAKVPDSDVWRYFCGCCWRELGQRQEMARLAVEDEEV